MPDHKTLGHRAGGVSSMFSGDTQSKVWGQGAQCPPTGAVPQSPENTACDLHVCVCKYTNVHVATLGTRRGGLPGPPLLTSLT